jgi:C-terminal processing protease CtpA/Prc
MAKDLVGKRKVHKEKGKEAGLGFTYKKLSNGLFEVSKIKPGGFAEKSGLIQPKDVVHFVDGTPCAGIAGPMAFAELLTGPVGSTCELSLSRGASEDVFVVTCTRMVAEAPAGAQGDLTSAVAAAASEQVKAPKDEDLQSIKSEASQSKSKVLPYLIYIYVCITYAYMYTYAYACAYTC